MDVVRLKVVREWLANLTPPARKEEVWADFIIGSMNYYAMKYAGAPGGLIYDLAKEIDPNVVFGIEYKGETIRLPYCTPGAAPRIQAAIVAEFDKLIAKAHAASAG